MGEILLGNISVERIQERLGFEFTNELIELLNDTHSESASVKNGKWHCFDIPFKMVCGGYDIAYKIADLMKQCDTGKAKERFEIAVDEVEE